MKLARIILALALGAAVVVSGTASAALPKKKPPCHLITDVADDAGVVGSTGNDTSLDVTSFDMASTDKKVTFVWRVKKAALKSSVIPVGGIQWDAAFDFSDYHLRASVASDGTKVTGIFSETATGNNKVISFTPATVDPAKNEIRMTVPASDFPERVKRAAVFSAFALSTVNGVIVLDTPAVSGSGGGLWGDSAEKAGATYKAGATNCVVVGK